MYKHSLSKFSLQNLDYPDGRYTLSLSPIDVINFNNKNYKSLRTGITFGGNPTLAYSFINKENEEWRNWKEPENEALEYINSEMGAAEGDVDDNDDEIILLDQTNEVLQNFYTEFQLQLKTKFLDKEPSLQELFKEVMAFSNFKMPGQEAPTPKKNQLIMCKTGQPLQLKEKRCNVIFLQEGVQQGTGVCRHQSLFSAFLLNQHFQKRQLSYLKVYLCRNDWMDHLKSIAHCWIVCKNAFTGQLFLVDPAWGVQFDLTSNVEYQQSKAMYAANKGWGNLTDYTIKRFAKPLRAQPDSNFRQINSEIVQVCRTDNQEERLVMLNNKSLAEIDIILYNLESKNTAKHYQIYPIYSDFVKQVQAKQIELLNKEIFIMMSMKHQDLFIKNLLIIDKKNRKDILKFQQHSLKNFDKILCQLNVLKNKKNFIPPPNLNEIIQDIKSQKKY